VAAFAKEEYQQRLKNVKHKMQEQGLDALWVTCPQNINYLSGYDAWSFYVHQGLLVCLNSDDPIWVGRHIDVSAAHMTSVLKVSCVVGYDETYITDYKHPMSFVADIIKQQGTDKGSVGVEMDTHYFTAQAFSVLSASLPNAQFKDADNLVNWVRLIKSPSEIAYLQQAGEITDIAMTSAIKAINVGVRQCDVAGLIFQKLISGHPKFYGDMPDYQTLPMGEKTAAPHLTWTDEPFKAGQLCTLELGANRYRYHAPLARTVFVGEPTNELNALANVVEDGLETALSAVRPGVQAQDVELAWRKVIKAAGIIKESRIGYSVGLGYPPDWGEQTVSLAPGDATELQENMVFHLMLGIWNNGDGYELSETFTVTENGASCLSRVPRKLAVKNG